MIRRVTVEDVGRGFRSGVHPLDDFFARHALANDRTGVSRCFVLTPDEPELPAVAGYYTLSMASISAEAVTQALHERLPRYPIPVALIGRLAVDQRARRRGFGEDLLVDALHRVLELSPHVGCVGVIVDAKDAAAEAFYARYDFAPLPPEGSPRRMFISMATVARTVER